MLPLTHLCFRLFAEQNISTRFRERPQLVRETADGKQRVVLPPAAADIGNDVNFCLVVPPAPLLYLQIQ